MQTVCVLGLGYIGLPTASVLATSGSRVLGVDVSNTVVDTVNQGNIHIEEPGLHTVVRAAIQSGNLRAATEPGVADVYIVAVPTPLNEDKTADMTFVRRATESIVPHLRRGALVILESTSPPGTCEELLRPILEQSGLRVGEDIYLAHCPERVLPGRILKELIENDRVIGGCNEASAERARELYATFVEGEIFLTDATTAEMVKLAENTYRDVNIALANEMALICERRGVDFWSMARYANRHPRVNIHSAGPGVGGHCISVDPWFLVEKDPGQTLLIQLARRRNDGMPRHVADRVLSLVADVASPKVALLGLAYKGNVDDIRESPALVVLALLGEAGVEVGVYDPHVRHGGAVWHDRDAALAGADCVVLLTDHAEYRDLTPEYAASHMRRLCLVDTRNHLDHAAWRAAGFSVHVLGRG